MPQKSLLRRPFRYSFFNATFILIAINICLFIFTELFPQLYYYLSLNVLYVTQGHCYWQFFTYMFVHSSITHILFNMIGLFFFGVTTERALGSKEFLLLYLLSGVVCGIVSFFIYWISGAYFTLLLGASGAIYAILLAYAVIFPRAQIFLFGILPIPAPILIAIYAAIEIVSQLFNLQQNVANLTHLTGFAFAWVYFLVRMGINPWKEWKNAYR